MERKRGKGQVSVEYTLIIGLIIMTLVVAVAVAFYYSASAKAQIRTNQIDKIGKKVTETSDSIYYLGPPSKSTIELLMPDRVHSINIIRQEGLDYIEFIYYGQGGYAKAYYYTKAEIYGDDTIQPLNDSEFKTPGIKRLEIRADYDTGENSVVKVWLSRA